MGEEWLTIGGAAQFLKLSVPTIYRLCAEGRLPFYTLPNRRYGRRFKRSELETLLEPGRTSRPG